VDVVERSFIKGEGLAIRISKRESLPNFGRLSGYLVSDQC